MKRFNLMLLSAVTATLLIGCGGGGSSSGSTSTNVPVTKGPLLEAIAKDASEEVGVHIVGTNEYKFTKAISYPITVTGGYVDVNNNGKVDEGDYEFKDELTSHSKVVTAITTYLGNPSDDDYQSKLETLIELSGASEDDLRKKDPKDISAEVLALNAAVYKVIDDEEITKTSLTTEYNSYKDLTTGTTSLNDALIAVEEQLIVDSEIEVLSNLDIEKMNFSKETLIGNKLTLGDETYYFRDNDIVLGDQGDEYGTIEDGTAKLMFENGDYDFIAITETGFDVSFYVDGELENEAISLTTELTQYTEDELASVLADIPFVYTEDMLLGKEIVLNEDSGVYKPQFNPNGVYTEVYDETKEWEVNSEKTGMEVTSTCTDNNTEDTFSIIFTEKPVVGTVFKTNSTVDGDETHTIDEINDIDESNISDTISIENSFGEDSLKNQTVYLATFGEEDDHEGDSSTNPQAQIIDKITISSTGSLSALGLLNSNASVENGYAGVKYNKLYTSENYTFDTNSYHEYSSGSISSGCIKTNYINTKYPDNNNTDYLFTDLNKAIGFVSLLNESNKDTFDCPSDTSTYISIENDFADESLKNKTLYMVWYGEGENENGESIDNVAVVEKVEIDSNGKATVTGLKNSTGGEFEVAVYNNRLYGRETDSYSFSDEYNNFESGSFSEGCIKTNYYEDGEIDNVDLIFTDETTALDFAEDLSATITACPSLLLSK